MRRTEVGRVSGALKWKRIRWCLAKISRSSMRQEQCNTSPQPGQAHVGITGLLASASTHHQHIKMRLFSSICVLLWALATSVLAKSAQGEKVLVVLEDAAEKELYSQFWADLQGTLPYVDTDGHDEC